MVNRKLGAKRHLHAAAKHDNKSRDYAIAALVVLEFIVIYISYIATALGIVGQWALALLSLFAVGTIIKRIGKFPGWNFFYMVGSKHGIKTIDNISKKNDGFWSTMPLWGMVMGFGIVTYPLLKGKVSKKVYAFGLVSLALILLFVLPYLSIALQFLHIPNLNSAIANGAVAHSAGIDYEGIAFDITSIIFGFAGFVIVAILYSAANFIAIALTHPAAPIAALGGQVPGVYPVIPGLDMPLVAGICALAILLIVHEFSHGVLARKAKVKLKSVGLLLVGVIPMGAFVEPDEKEVEKLDKLAQTKIFAAGISANFILIVVFFALMLFTIVFLLPLIEVNEGVYVTSTV
ncbi:peptidase M50, partial [mine drainage metagenome]